VHEYLLSEEYRLTAVTFTEENASQDFDDWDDVGINVARPPDLLRLYREFGHCRSSSGATLCEAGTSTEDQLLLLAPAVANLRQSLDTHISGLDEQICTLESENVRLLRAVEQMERNQLQPLVSTPTVSPIKLTNHAEVHRKISSAAFVADVPETASADDSRSISENFEVSAEPPSGPSEEENYLTATEEAPKKSDLISDNQNDFVSVAAVESAVSSPGSTVRPDNSGNGVEAVESPSCKTNTAFQQLLLDSVFHVVPDNRIFSEVLHIAELSDDAVGKVSHSYVTL